MLVNIYIYNSEKKPYYTIGYGCYTLNANILYSYANMMKNTIAYVYPKDNRRRKRIRSKTFKETIQDLNIRN